MKWAFGIIVLLLSLIMLSQIGALRAERDHPPIGQFAVVDGLRLHYTDTGEGPPVVLIHGASTSLLDFEASLIDPLSTTHRVIAVDRPGHGYSDRSEGDWPDPADQARAIHGLLEHLGIDTPLLVGHSWSGSVVLAYLLAYPEHASGGVLLAGGSHAWEGGVAWYIDLAGLPGIGELFARTLAYPLGRLALDAAIANVFAPNPVPEGYREKTGITLSLRPSTFLANAEDIGRLSDFLAQQSPRYEEIKRPVLLLTASDDDIVPSWNHADRLQNQLARFERIDFDATGHALHHARADEVTSAIRTFATEAQLSSRQTADRRSDMGPQHSRPDS